MDRPKKCLGVEPSITSEAELGQALGELSWITTQTAAVQTDVSAEVAAIKQRYESHLVCRVGRSNVSFADRVAALTTAVIAFATVCKAALLGEDPKVKTLTLTHGEIKWQEQRETIAIDEETLKPLAEQVADSVKAHLAGLKLKGVFVGELFDAKPSLSKTRTLDALAQGRVTAKQLAAFGLSKERPDEKVLIKPFDYEVVSASSEAA